MYLSDQDLIVKSCGGDLDAFEELVKKYEAKVYTIAFRLLGNHADASDMAQEVFIKVYKSLAKFRGESSFQTWMYQIVNNTCKDELRKRKTRGLIVDEPLENLEGAIKKEDHKAIDINPELALAQKETQLEIQSCLNALPFEHRMVLILREIQGFSYDEIAKHLECNLGTVKSRVSRARLAFREIYLARQKVNNNQDSNEGRRENYGL